METNVFFFGVSLIFHLCLPLSLGVPKTRRIISFQFPFNERAKLPHRPFLNTERRQVGGFRRHRAVFDFGRKCRLALRRKGDYDTLAAGSGSMSHFTDVSLRLRRHPARIKVWDGCVRLRRLVSPSFTLRAEESRRDVSTFN